AGRYELALAPGAYFLTAERDGYAGATAEVSVARATVYTFRLSPAARVSGKAVDDTDAPVAGASVSLEGGKGGVQRAVSDASGAFVLANLAPGRYTLSARSPGGLVARLPAFDVDAAAHLANLTLPMKPGALLSGRVLTAAGRPVAGAELRLHGTLFDV